MKKLLIITTATCLFLVSCSKYELKPNSNFNETSLEKVERIPPAPITPQKFVITNTETNLELVRDYRLVYTDLNGQVQNVALAAGKSIALCLNNPAIKTNFSYSMVDIGGCR